MRRGTLQASLLMGALSLTTAAAGAQEIIHALTGKVTAVYPKTDMIQVATDDGSPNTFNVLTQTNVPLNFEKDVKAMTVPANSFTKADCNVVVFYFGDQDIRTTVAVEDLGAGPLVKTLGTVVKFDKHARLLTILDDAGQQKIFHIDAKTIADGMSGVVLGQKFDPDKGEKVRVTATTQDGAQTALFIRALSL
jgi:hypothetical protein